MTLTVHRFEMYLSHPCGFLVAFALLGIILSDLLGFIDLGIEGFQWGGGGNIKRMGKGKEEVAEESCSGWNI